MKTSLCFLAVALFLHPSLLAQGMGVTGHAVSGKVREAGTDAPIQGVSLEIASSGNQFRPSVISGTSGDFSFNTIPEGQYNLTAKKDGYETATMSVMVFTGGAPAVVISLRKVTPETPHGPGELTTTRQLAIPQKARQAFEKGRKLLEEKGDPAKAIPEFQKAIDFYPSYYEAYTEIGVANYSLRNFRDTEEALKKAIQLSSHKDAQSTFLLSDLYNGQQRYAEAEPLARESAALEESSWRGPFELARALVGLKRGAEAEASAQKAQELKPDNAPVYLTLANAHMLEQKYPAVLQDFDSYLKLVPSGLLSDNVRQRREKLQHELQQASQ